MEEKLTYIAKKNELTHKKAVYLELKKGPKVFHKDDISIVTEFSKLGEVMQSALLSIELTKLNETPKILWYLLRKPILFPDSGFWKNFQWKQ